MNVYSILVHGIDGTVQVLIKDWDHGPERACGGDDAVWHTNGQGGQVYTQHHTESTVDVPCNMAGRYVKIHTNDPGFLVLCEVFVYEADVPYSGTESPSLASTTASPTLPYIQRDRANAAYGKPASQSSDWRNVPSADAGVDGYIPRRLNSATWCTHTNREANAWWEVDLQAEFSITNVTIVGRTHQTNQGDDLQVFIGNFPGDMRRPCGGADAVYHTAGRPGNA